MCLVQQNATNSSTLPAKICRYHDTNHHEYKEKDVSFFKRKLETLTNCQSLMVKSSNTDNENTRGLLKVSHHIALAGEAIQCRKHN
jgi:hypothetical protein